MINHRYLTQYNTSTNRCLEVKHLFILVVYVVDS